MITPAQKRRWRSSGLSVLPLMELNQAREAIFDQFSTWPFDDWQTGDDGRLTSSSLAVHVACMLALACPKLMSLKSPRLGVFYSANAPRSGKTLMAKAALSPVYQTVSVQPWPKDEAELRKSITSRLYVPGTNYLFYDNLRGLVSSPVLEAFMTSNVWIDRELRTNKNVVRKHCCTVILTGNDASLSPDLYQRFLQCNLFVTDADAQNREIEHPLSEETLSSREWRYEMLGALNSLVMHWMEAGKPSGCRSIRGFEEWCNTYAGIVYFAGLGDCLVKPPLEEQTMDSQTSEIYQLVRILAQTKHVEDDRDDNEEKPRPQPVFEARQEWSFAEIVHVCHSNDLLLWKIKDGSMQRVTIKIPGREFEQEVERWVLKPAAKSSFGRFLSEWFPLVTERHENRFRDFLIEGCKIITYSIKPKHREYIVETK